MKKITIILASIWSVLTLCLGTLFIKKYYQMGVQNICYRPEIEPGIIGQIIWAVIAYLIAILVIYGFVDFLVKVFRVKDKERQIALFSIPFLGVLGLKMAKIIYHSNLPLEQLTNFYVGDEKNIWDAAVRLYPNFFVYTSEVYLICFFILPIVLAPSIIKIVMCSVIMGYTVYRIWNHYHSWLVALIYLYLFALEPIRGMGVQVHRMHWYAMLYLFLMVKLFFDCKEGIDYNTFELVIISMIISVLSVWRREGIYLLPFGVIFLLVHFNMINHSAGQEQSSEKQSKIRILFVFIAIWLAVYLPLTKNGLNEKGVTASAYFVYMLSEQSLDREKIKDDLGIADKYLDIQTIDRFNNEMGIKAYDETFYLYPDYMDNKYYAIKEGTSINDEELMDAVLDIIKKQPIVFIKSRIHAFAALCRSLNSYNLIIPTVLLLVITCFGIITKDTILSSMSIGVVIHTGLTAVAMPASFFKYFYQMYLYAYIFILVIILEYKDKQRNNKELG